MNVADDVGTAEDQDLAAVFLAPVVVEGGVALLDVGAHGAVVDYDAVLTSWRNLDIGGQSFVDGRSSFAVSSFAFVLGLRENPAPFSSSNRRSFVKARTTTTSD